MESAEVVFKNSGQNPVYIENWTGLIERLLKVETSSQPQTMGGRGSFASHTDSLLTRDIMKQNWILFALTLFTFFSAAGRQPSWCQWNDYQTNIQRWRVAEVCGHWRAFKKIVSARKYSRRYSLMNKTDA